jgi:pentatricopeptide repeat-containing protein PET309
MLKSHQGGILQDTLKATTGRGGSLTHVWNMLIQHYALQKDVSECRRLYREMIEHEIPLDSWTYASLMRGLIEMSQTNAAYKILRVTMPNNNLQVHAFHYAIVMTGFLHERQYDLAEHAYKRMIATKVPQTATSRLASLEVLGALDMRKLRKERDRDPRTRLKQVEEALREILLTDYESEVADRQPRHSKQIDSRHNVPEGYFGFLILLYGTRRAFDICKELFEAAAIAREDQADYTPPITLLTAVMDTHFRAREHGEVARCWELAKQQADNLVKTLDQIVTPSPPQPEFDSVTDGGVRKSFEEARIAKNRRQVLTMPTRIYIRSLAAQEDPTALAQAQRAVRNLLTSGFVLDNLTWNELIQMQARRGATVDAFTTCETYLMPNFPGWRDLHPFYFRNDRRDYKWMEVTNKDIHRNTLMPRYKTLVILARVLAEVRRLEVEGVGWNPETGAWDSELLERMCPMTVSALVSMPMTGDKTQRKFLQGYT